MALKLIRNAVLFTVGTVSLVAGITGVFLSFFPETPFLTIRSS